ncbi:3-alpha-hydroxysteroid dehydrogenase [Prauserella marina]|uniref:3alpha(Or 20beta)-hydroxysteroid dehydrogenase n=1 Tax=Prauserella marina TaxID=530584 RepID=A0A222VQR4_9PSEU|nr:SDR family NAD(P)-dependent oxidoreductase [Prauserella marina]ASR36257.1 3-alpha-hydroxysteroid dehydrogenase [Prauserella marina]PWV77027.1 3alpha(or 20beta)-hydroxysteroid dehydrogenase [Prauserella marina]SDD02684.1 3alpha(or 20beta)-hydroxysteroid dehydrogenase [Prauserella marina]
MKDTELMGLTGKVAVITGAARGQGAAEAALFTELGADTVLTDVDDADGEAVAAKLGHRATYLSHDTASAAGWARVVETVAGRYGRIDILVNNAGVYWKNDLADWPEADLRALLDINLVGPVLGMKAVVPVMSRGGSIVNVASISGMRGHAGALPYAASKWGLRGASRSAAREFAPLGIRVNCVCPGAVDTPMVDAANLDLSHLPIPRPASPEEIAVTVAFLASDASAYTTGTDVVVDGGATA